METLSALAAFAAAIVCFTIGTIMLVVGGRKAVVRHHHTFGYDLSFTWVFFAVAAVAVLLGAMSLS